MKAAYYTNKEQLELVELETPKIGCGEALVKVKYTGICGSDIHVFHGAHPTAKFPVVPGHEFVGELAELNDASGNDNVCQELKLLGAHCNGSFAEYVKVPAKKMYRIPKDVDFKLAALAEPLAVAVHDVRRSQLKVGQKALVIGGGPIGLFIAMVARLVGAEVYISEVNEFRLNYAKDMGFKTLNPKDEDFDQQVKTITNGKYFDVVFEVSGSKAGAASMTKLAKISGMVVIVGMAGDNYPVDLMSVFTKQLKLQGVRIHTQEAFAAAVDILVSGELNDQLYKLISKTFALEDIKAAFEYMHTNTDHFKILLEV